MMPLSTNFHNSVSFSITRLSVRNSCRYLRTACGVAASGVPRLTRRTPMPGDGLGCCRNRCCGARRNGDLAARCISRPHSLSVSLGGTSLAGAGAIGTAPTSGAAAGAASGGADSGDETCGFSASGGFSASVGGVRKGSARRSLSDHTLSASSYPHFHAFSCYVIRQPNSSVTHLGAACNRATLPPAACRCFGPSLNLASMG